MNMKQIKKQLILNIPYIVLGLVATNLGEMWRLAVGVNASEKVQSIVLDGLIAKAFSNPLPSLYPTDLLVGIACGVARQERHSRAYRLTECFRMVFAGLDLIIIQRPSSFRISTISWHSRRIRRRFLRNGVPS